MKKFFLISILLNIILFCSLLFLGCYKTNFFKHIIAKLRGQTLVSTQADYDCISSWNSCIRKLDLDVDMVFFGDSITEGGEWQTYFPNKKTITLAYIGEDIKRMLRRVAIIAEVKPEKVFIMAGINGLKKQSLSEFKRDYCTLLDSICNVVPSATIYVQSILPVSDKSDYCSNEKILNANRIIENLVSDKKSKRIQYINLWSVYSKNGVLPDMLSYDGLHITCDAYALWANKIREFVE